MIRLFRGASAAHLPSPLRAGPIALLVRPLAVVLLCGSGCLPSFELPEQSPAPAATCGGSGQACCEAPASPCDADLGCDAGTSTCQPQAARQCVTDENCSVGQTCCVSGLLGTCVRLEAGADCPRADLQIVTTRATLGLTQSLEVFDPAVSKSDACALEKMCIGGAGVRRLLSFSTTVTNTGDADLLLGAPSAAPFLRAACDDQPYLANFLSYTLIDLQGTPIAKGSMQAQSGALPAPFSDAFDADFYGLAAGFSQIYPKVLPASDPSFDAFTCQWVDITDVPAGSYILRLRVNPGGALLERDDDNNQVDLPIALPRYDNPTQLCPTSDPDKLLGVARERECGWQPPAATARCVPGQSVTLACPDCEGDPMLRVCEGTAACVSTSALADGDGTGVACNGGADIPEDDCSDRCCAGGSACPTVRFDCPASGLYTAYTAAFDATSPARCNVTVQPVVGPGANGSP